MTIPTQPLVSDLSVALGIKDVAKAAPALSAVGPKPVWRILPKMAPGAMDAARCGVAPPFYGSLKVVSPQYRATSDIAQRGGVFGSCAAPSAPLAEKQPRTAAGMSTANLDRVDRGKKSKAAILNAVAVCG